MINKKKNSGDISLHLLERCLSCSVFHAFIIDQQKNIGDEIRLLGNNFEHVVQRRC